MAEVYIDGERVEFEGDPPATLGALNALLVGVLGSNGRVLVRLMVDGRSGAECGSEYKLDEAVRIDAASLSQAEAADRVRGAIAEALLGMLESLDELAATVLRVPWQEARLNCVELAVRVGEILENTAALAEAAEIGPAAGEAVEATGLWVDAVQKADAARVSFIIDDALLPAFQRLAAVMQPGEAAPP